MTGFEPLIDGLDLPDPDDRHVLAAAVRAGARLVELPVSYLKIDRSLVTRLPEDV